MAHLALAFYHADRDEIRGSIADRPRRRTSRLMEIRQSRHDLKRAIEILEEFNRLIGVDRNVNSMSAPYVRLVACWETRMASRKPLRQ